MEMALSRHQSTWLKVSQRQEKVLFLKAGIYARQYAWSLHLVGPMTNYPVMILCPGQERASLNEFCCGIEFLVKSAIGLKAYENQDS